MTLDQTKPASSQGLCIPDDLRQLIEDRTLVCRVLEAIHAPCPRPEEVPSDASSRERVLRTLVLYCYACGVYDSRDIEQAAAQESTATYICAGYQPDWT